MLEVDDASMPKLYVGIIIVSTLIALVTGVYYFTHEDDSEPIEIEYTITACLRYSPHGGQEEVTVVLSDKPSHPEKVELRVNYSEHHWSSIPLAWAENVGVCSFAYTEGGGMEDGHPLPTDDLSLFCDGYKFVKVSLL